MPRRTFISKVIEVHASPHEIYDILMDSEKHARLTGATAVIEPEVGGSIAMYGGYITGTNLELVPGALIVQSWRTTDWAPHILSHVRFELTATEGGTAISFEQTGIPVLATPDIEVGWEEYYWKPLTAMFGSR